MAAVNFTEFGFFDGIMKVDQENWPKFFSDHISSGVIAGVGNNLQVYANSSGMKVIVKSGSCMIRAHRGTNTNETELAIAAANATYPRIDLVVARAVYGNTGESYMCLDVLTGAPSASPAVPILTQTAAVIWEIPLAQVAVAAGASTITAGNVTDARIYSVVPLALGGTGAITASGALSNIFGGSSLPIANGGTGQTSVAAARNAFGLGNTTGAVPIANGGTGQTTIAAARNAFGLGNTTGALPVANGGTGVTTAAAARTALGVKDWYAVLVSIAVADWDANNLAAKTVSGVLAGAASQVWDSPADASYAMYSLSDVRLYSNALNTVTWKCTVKPTTAITVTVVWTA